MGSVVSFVLIYLLGGLTFVPLVVLLAVLHVHFTAPVRHQPTAAEHDPLVHAGDDAPAVASADRSNIPDKYLRRSSIEADVAAGYFAVCREYVPGGIKGKPPERTTPSGSTTVVTSPSPSVYQSMYRTIFDRKNNASPFENKGGGKPTRRGGNVFYVVLRHGHLMLYDDDEMVEVRYVISLTHHRVSLYGGGEDIPEGELFIKRNAICLASIRDADATADGDPPKPFYLFSENCSEKEDFYFALLQNQERKPDASESPPAPIRFDVKHIVSLVQRLHSSEDSLQTRWINALLGRVFLGIYKTADIEDFLRGKITKKISRVKTPSFLSGIVLQKIDMGEEAPYLTNPRLKDLTVDGDTVVEADIRYTGNFHIEVAATARIELGARFKAREVNLVLAVVLKKLEGHVLVKIKPPPSNRFWITFESPPHMELKIEPIVSTRQITYGIILRQIESRIKEVVAETLVYPFWDDMPFFNTEGSRWRGGIFSNQSKDRPSDLKTAAAQDGHVDEVHDMEAADKGSLPVASVENGSETSSIFSRRSTRSSRSVSNLPTAAASGVEAKPMDMPRVIRSGSFAGASSPIVSMDNTHADVFKPASPPDQTFAASAMAAISARSRTNSAASSPSNTPAGSFSPPNGNHFSQFDKLSEEELGSLSTADAGPTDDPESDGTTKLNDSNKTASLSSASASTLDTDAPEVDQRENMSSAGSVRSVSMAEKRTTLSAMTNAAISAKNWGLGAIARGTAPRDKPPAALNLSEPMGRGRPLPPPGVPLPPPDRKSRTAPIPVPKRKPLPPPVLPSRSDAAHEDDPIQRRPVPPPLPKRPEDELDHKRHSTGEGMLVVAAPTESEPTTPMDEKSQPTYSPWEGEAGPDGDATETPPDDTFAFDPAEASPRAPRRDVANSPEDEYKQLPTWMAAQEEEARSKSVWGDHDTGAS